MPSPDLVTVGKVGRPHGVDGAFFVDGASDDPQWFQVGTRLRAGGEELEVVAARRGSGGRPVIRLSAAVSRGTPLEVAREALPPTDEDEYYTFELVGLEVIEEGGRRLGAVASVNAGVANDVLALDTGILLPLVAACVRDIDLETGRILVGPGFAEPD